MLCEVRSLGLSGISGYEVRAECDLSAGLPAFEIVGLPDAAVKEARDRVRAAIKNCGFTFPVSRITVNLAPANQRKGGTVYDLPILAGILAAGGQLRLDGPDSAYVGELSLSGSLRPVVGMLPMALAARRAGIKRLYVPAPSAADYQDVPPGAWYYGAVDYVVSQGLLSGSSRSRFSPEQPLTRAMLAQVLFQLAGQPDGGLTHFVDVPDTAWCYSAVSWAVSRDIMSGVDGETFAPERPPTRQELAFTLFRYAKEAGLDTKVRADLTPYSDAGQVAGWAREAVEWAVAQGLLAGRSTGSTQTLAPLGTVTRAEFSAVLKTLCETVLPKQ